ncbi:M20/M25/M40 family metallo-hydrolase [Paenibacillus agilis]|uniref:M20/M25/M40 family metallo-hydrolase n=1 Tax=Paenibacillus agilis TaxID=3020863 RepID=UPI0021BDE2D9|nr:M20/M25/M40 family metallo-hydrolase [Paenibacillus agilis]
MERVVTNETIRNLKGIKIISIGLAIFVLIFATLLIDQPPRPKPSTAPVKEFSAERAMQHLQQIAKDIHHSGSKQIEDVRQYLMAELTRLGVQPYTQQEVGITYDNQKVDLHNIIGVLKGKSSGGKVLVLMSHYDSVDMGPGANDAGTGVAALLEAVRALTNNEQLQNDIWIVLTDGEEMGLQGANGFWKRAEHLEQIGLVVNFEARGSKGASLMFQTSEDNGVLIEHFAQAAPEPVANSFMGDIYRLLPNQTDLTVSLRAGIPGINFAYVDGWTAYHTPEDNLDNVDLSTLQHHGENALAMARQFGNINLENLRTSDHVYFNLFGLLIHYPSSLVVPIAFILWVAFSALLFVASRQQHIRLRGMTTSLLALVGSALLSLVLSFVLYQLVYMLWASKVTLFNGATYDAYLYHISFLLLTLLVHGFLLKKLHDRINELEMMLTGMLFFLLLLTASVIWLPGASYLWMIPLIIHSIVIGFSLYKKDAKVLSGVPAMLVTAVVPVTLFTSLFHLLFIAMPPFKTIVVTIILTLIIAMLNPIFRLLSFHYRWFVTIVAASIVVLLAWGWIHAVPSEERPVFEHLYERY